MLRIALSLAIAGTFAGAAGAATRADTNPPVIAVAYDDLDLTSQAGTARLDQRIHSAVASVCGEAAQADLGGKNRVHRCRATARQAAAAQRDHLLAAHSTPATLAAR
jgi:UrcA family protein